MNPSKLAEWFASQRTDRRVLLVEDDAHDAFLTTHTLSSDYVRIDHAPTAEAGITLAKTRTYDLALVDLNLPGMNGLDFARWMRISFPAMVIAILSGCAESPLVNDALREGFIILPKPIQAGHLSRLSANDSRMFAGK